MQPGLAEPYSRFCQFEVAFHLILVSISPPALDSEVLARIKKENVLSSVQQQPNTLEWLIVFLSAGAVLFIAGIVTFVLLGRLQSAQGNRLTLLHEKLSWEDDVTEISTQYEVKTVSAKSDEIELENMSFRNSNANCNSNGEETIKKTPPLIPFPVILTPPPQIQKGTSNTFGVPPWHLNPVFNPPAREISVTPSLRGTVQVQNVKQRRRSVSTSMAERQIEDDSQRVRHRFRELKLDMEEQIRYMRQTLSYTHTGTPTAPSSKQFPPKSPVQQILTHSSRNLSVQRI